MFGAYGPDQVNLKAEFEIEDDSPKLEIKLTEVLPLDYDIIVRPKLVSIASRRGPPAPGRLLPRSA